MPTVIVKSPSVASAMAQATFLDRYTISPCPWPLVYPYTSSPFYKEGGLTDYLVSNCQDYRDSVPHPVPPDNRNRLK